MCGLGEVRNERFGKRFKFKGRAQRQDNRRVSERFAQTRYVTRKPNQTRQKPPDFLPGYLENPENELKITDEKFTKIVRLLDKTALESDVFQKFPDSDKAVTVKIISVDGAYRGQGIAKELLNKTR